MSESIKLSKSQPLLLIDDNQELVETLAELLNEEGLIVRIANEAQMAIELIAKETFSFILCDLNLSGIFMTDKILTQAKARNPNQAFAIMSGGEVRGDERMAQVLRQFPEVLIFSKPFDMNRILELF